MKQLGIRITHNFKDLLKQSKQADAELEKLRKKKVDIQVQLDKKKDLQNQMRAIQAEIAKINAKKLDIKVSTNNALSQIKEIEKRLASRTEKIQIRAEAGDVSAVSRLYKEIQDLEKKKIKLSVDVTEGRESIKRLSMDADELRAKKASIKVQADGIEETQQSLNAVDRQINQLNGKKIKFDAFAVGQSISKGAGYISDLTNSISKVSFAPIEAGAKAAMDVIQRLSGAAKSVFSEIESDINMEKVFRQNQALLKVDTSETDAVYKELDKYADRTVFNAAEMLNTYNALFNSGTKDTTELVKGLGAISATAADSKQAMSTMSLQFSQAMINGLQRTDLRYMLEATNGGLAVAFSQAGKDLKEFQRQLGEANERTDPGVRTRLAKELEEVIRSAANNPEMNKLAETPKEISQALGVVTDSLVNVTKKGFKPLQDVGIKWLLKLSDNIEILKNSKGLDEFGAKLADLADDKLAKVYDYIKKTDFKKLWSSFSDGFKDSLEELSDSLGIYKALFKNIFNLGDGDLDIYDAANKIGTIVPKFVEYGIKFKEASLLFKGAAAGFDVFSTIARYANIKLPAGGLFSKLLGGGSNAASAITAPAINVNAFKTLAKGLGVVAGLAGTLYAGAKALQEVNKIKIDKNLAQKMIDLGTVLTATGGAVVIAGSIVSTPATALIAGAGAATLLGLSATLAAAAKSVQTLNGIKLNGRYTEKIGKIGEVLTELSSVTGKLLVESSNFNNLDKWFNTKLQAGQLKSFGQMVETLNEIAKVPEINTEEIKEKLRSVKESLNVLDEGEFQFPGLTTITSFFEGIHGFVEAIKDKANASSLKSFATMAKSLEDIQGAENLDTEKIKTNLTMIRKALNAVQDQENELPAQRIDVAIVNKLFGGLWAWADALKEKGNASKLKSLVEMLQSFEAMSDAKISPKKIGKTFAKLKEAVEEVNGSGIAEITQLMKEGNFEDAAKATKSLKGILDNVSGLSKNLKVTDIKVNIGHLSEIINQIDSSFKALTEDKDGINFTKLNSKLTPIKDIMSKMASIVKNATKSTGNIDYTALKANISVLQTFFNDISNQLYYLSKSGEKEGSLSLEDTEARLGDLNGIIKKMGDIVKNAQEATGNIDATSLLANLDVISRVFDEIKKTIGSLNAGQQDETQLPTLGNADFGSDTDNQSIEDALVHLEQTSQALAKMGAIVREAQDATGNIDGQSLITNLGVVKTMFEQIRGILGSLGESSSSQQTGELPTLENSNFNGNVDNGGIDDALSNMDQALVALQKMGAIVREAQEATGFIDGEKLIANIGASATILKEIKKALSPFAKGGDESFNLGDINSKLDTLSVTMTKLQSIISTASGIPGINLNYDADENGIFSKIDRIRRTIVQINDLPTPEGLAGIQELLQGVGNLANTLNGLSGQFTPVGKGYGTELLEGFQSVDLETPATSKVKALLNRLISMASYFTEAGRLAGNAYGQGLTSALSAIDVTSAGNRLGSQLKTSILSALSGLGTEIEQNIKATEIANRIASTISSATSSSSNSRDDNWTGGLIGGSTAFAGVDTIPINASQGEFMMPRKAVSKYGLSLMEAIRNLNFRMPTLPTMAAVPAQSVSNTSSEDNSKVIYNINIEGKSDAMTRLKASKYTRGMRK